MMEHSPGEWMEVSRVGVDFNGEPLHSSIEVPSPEGARVIGVVLGCAEADANSALWLAAPTMLQAMRMALTKLEPFHEDCDVRGELCESLSFVSRPSTGSDAHSAIRMLRFASARAVGVNEYTEQQEESA